MNIRSLRSLTLAVLVAATTVAHASITSYSDFCSGQSILYTSNSGYFDLNSFNATNPFSWSDTGSQYENGYSLFGYGSYSSTLAASSTSLDLVGRVYDYLEADNYFTYSGGYSYGSIYKQGGFNFTLDNAGVVNLSQTTYGANQSGGGYTTCYSFLYLDGTYYTYTPGTVSFTVNVSAGSHVAFFYSGVSASNTGYAYNSQFSYNNANYELRVDSQPVPEPTSMAVLALGAIGVIRRRHNRSA
ncbi:MAG: PEP-CTERM sorting domain-containing protein [Armatimonadetes bacterium]|nr:PEP-CTERM sorting domain-containing protein [Armatimonadota bacterium]